jgi:hypothetical protein
MQCICMSSYHDKSSNHSKKQSSYAFDTQEGPSSKTSEDHVWFKDRWMVAS